MLQSGHLDVVVSPDILNGPGLQGVASLEEGLINEGGQTQLVCSATGVPEPTVQWRREDGKDIVVRSVDGRDKQCNYIPTFLPVLTGLCTYTFIECLIVIKPISDC